MKKLLSKYSQIISYIIFGVATTAVNWVVYGVLVSGLQVDLNISNIIAWFAAVIFAYITNKIWVFQSRSWNVKCVAKEIILFFSSRLASGSIEILLFPILISCGIDGEIFGVQGFVTKLSISVIVIILNYIFSKLMIFREITG